MTASRRDNHRVRQDALYVKYTILSVMLKMATCPSASAGVGQGHRPHLQSQAAACCRFPASRHGLCSSAAGTLILSFSWVVSLHATVASSGLNRRTHLGRYSLKRNESTVA